MDGDYVCCNMGTMAVTIWGQGLLQHGDNGCYKTGEMVVTIYGDNGCYNMGPNKLYNIVPYHFVNGSPAHRTRLVSLFQLAGAVEAARLMTSSSVHDTCVLRSHEAYNTQRGC